MAHQIRYDRAIGPTATSTVSDETTTTLTVTSETAPTTVTAVNYCNFVFQLSGPGDTAGTVPATATDTQGSSYTLIKEVKFGSYCLDVFTKIASTPNVSTTVTVTHQPSKNRIIMSDEWYNIGSHEHTVSAFSSTATAQVDTGEFKVGKKRWLTYAALAIGGSPHGDSVTVPDDWNLIEDTGTNYGEGSDIRLLLFYQIANKRKKMDFKPVIANPRVWAAVMFSYKEKL